MIGDVAELARLMVTSPLGGFIACLLLVIILIMTGVIPTPREYREMAVERNFYRDRAQTLEREQQQQAAHNARMIEGIQLIVDLLDTLNRHFDVNTVSRPRENPPRWPQWLRIGGGS